MKFHLLNVFTKSGDSSGNQLAVVLPERELSSEEMQAITRNFNFSETIFIRNEKLRIFTPRDELPFAGHPTVGAAWLFGKITGKTDFVLTAPLGVLKMRSDNEAASVLFPGTPVISQHSQDLGHLLPKFSLSIEQVEFAGVKNVNSGPDFLMVPVKSHGALKAISVPVKNTVRTYFFFEHDEKTFSVRMIGSREDAATGSAACALVGYLRDYLNRPSGRLTISQGAEMNRPSEIRISWDVSKIVLEGNVTEWGSGEL